MKNQAIESVRFQLHKLKTVILMRSLWVCIWNSDRANAFCVHRNNACNVRFLYSVYIKYTYILQIHLTTDVGRWCGCCFCRRCLVHDSVRLFIFTFQWESQTNVWHAFTKFLYSFFPYYIYGPFFSFPLLRSCYSLWFSFTKCISMLSTSYLSFSWTKFSSAHMFRDDFFEKLFSDWIYFEILLLCPFKWSVINQFCGLNVNGKKRMQRVLYMYSVQWMFEPMFVPIVSSKP